jgi:hypothetical protein
MGVSQLTHVMPPQSACASMSACVMGLSVSGASSITTQSHATPNAQAIRVEFTAPSALSAAFNACRAWLWLFVPRLIRIDGFVVVLACVFVLSRHFSTPYAYVDGWHAGVMLPGPPQVSGIR